MYNKTLNWLWPLVSLYFDYFHLLKCVYSNMLYLSICKGQFVALCPMVVLSRAFNLENYNQYNFLFGRVNWGRMINNLMSYGPAIDRCQLCKYVPQ